MTPSAKPGAWAPTRAGERIQLLDALRGAAILGIVLVNVHAMARPIYYELLPELHADGPWDVGVRLLTAFFVESKFYTLFSFMFGVGMGVQFDRCRAKGHGFTGFFARRMAVLAALGLIHGILIWYGDILLLYAVLGFVLMAFQHARQGWLLVVAVLGVLASLGIYALFLLIGMAARATEPMAEAYDKAIAAQGEKYRETLRQATEAYSGGYLESTSQRLTDMGFMYGNMFVYLGLIFAAFALGLWAWRRGLLREPERHERFFRGVWLIGLPLGVLCNGFYAYAKTFHASLEPTPVVFGGLMALAVGQFAFAAVFLALVAKLTQADLLGRLRAALAAVGRMALTNYVLQSVVLTLLFYGYGFGLMGETSYAVNAALAIGLFLLQIPLSRWWMARFRFGPLEWLWRTLTYGRRQPMKR